MCEVLGSRAPSKYVGLPPGAENRDQVAAEPNNFSIRLLAQSMPDLKESTLWIRCQ